MRQDWDRLTTLFLHYREGDLESTAACFDGFTQLLIGFFRVRMNQDSQAEDLVQVTLLKIHFAREKYDPERSLKTWLFTIAERSLIDHWRGLKAHDSLDDLPELAQGANIISDNQWNQELKVQLHRDLNRSLSTLKPIDRTIVYLYAVEDLTMAEVAKVVGMTEAAVKVRAHRSYAKMKETL